MINKINSENMKIIKYSNSELLKMDTLEVYKLRLNNDINRFPIGFWENSCGIENSLICSRYLLENILNWSIDDIKSKVRASTFIKYKLGGMLSILYRNSPYEILSKLYPNEFMPWELHEAPTKFWHDKNNRLLAMDWLINTKLKWTKEDIIENYNNQVLIDNGLCGLLYEGGYSSSFSLLDEFMPNEFYPWSLKSSSSGPNFWMKKENRIFAIKNMIENVLKWDKDDIRKKLNQETFKDNNLNGLLNKYYDGSPYKVVQEIYPNEFLPWELSCTPIGFWDNKENRVAAIKWLFETKLSWSIEDIKKNINQKVFIDNGLSSLLGKVEGGLYEIVSEAYPNQIKPWEMPFTKSSYWLDKNNRIDVLDYLFKTKLNWSIDDIKRNLSQKTLIDNNLNGLLYYYNGSPYELIKDYIPNENIKPWELSVTPNGFWKNDDNCIEVIYWMIDKFKLNVYNVSKVNRKFLEDHKLYSLVTNKYNSSMREFKKDIINIIVEQRNL